MRITSGKVTDGKIDVSEASFREGQRVTSLAVEDHETFELGPREEADLLAAMAEGDRGEVMAADEVLRELGRPR
jgi:hypothetical protein